MKLEEIEWKLVESDYEIDFGDVGKEYRGMSDREKSISRMQNREKFINSHNLKESKSYCNPSWVKVLPLESQRLMRVKYSNRFIPRGEFKFMDYAESHIHDHHDLFVRNGRYTYITQPYDLTLSQWREIKTVFGKRGLCVKLSLIDAWHFPGETPLVIISQSYISTSEESQ